jgi:serine/threonine-protein kinase
MSAPASAPQLDDAPTGRYVLYDEIAAGGMATVHLGRQRGPVGFARIVAIKRLHAHFAKDPDFALMFLDEARLAARIRHPNVVSTVDVVSEGADLLLVMEYVAGESLSRLFRASRRKGLQIPPRVAAAIVAGLLHGLHAAHEAKSDHGEPLLIVHRDVSPQNVLVATDGVARVFDFGVAKAEGRFASTREGTLKGKIAYMAPEQLRSRDVDRRVDVYAAGVVLWELLSGQRLFEAEQEVQLFDRVLAGCVTPPSAFVTGIDPRLDAIVLRAIATDPRARFPTARDMARALEGVGIAAATEVGDWVESLAGALLAQRAERVAEIESRSDLIARPASASGTVVASPKDDPSTRRAFGPAPSQDFDQAPARPRTRRIALAAVALLCVAMIAVAGFVLRTRTRTTAPLAPPAPAVAAAAPAPVNDPAPTIELTATAPTPAAPLPPRARPVVRRPAATTTAAPPPTTAPAPAATPAADCDPPYYFDDEGTKRYKRGCL